MHQRRVPDLLGAHVSTQGGVHNALARGKAIGASAIQVFTKTPNQWREPALSEEARTAFRRECDRSEIARIVAHDSYLINLATPDPARLAQALSGPRVGEPHVATLERAIDAHEDALEPLRNFILPGGTPKAAAFHLARTVCRRAERAVVRLAHETTVSTDILKYLNRLSDLLFVLARATNARAGVRDVTW